MEGIIYRYLFPSGKSYIGQTIQILSKRTSQHNSEAYKLYHQNYNTKLSKAIRKYNKEYKIEVLEDSIPQELLDEKEQKWIEFFNSYNNGYNSTPGGLGKPIKANTYKINPEEWNTIYNLYLSGKTIIKISEEYSCNREIISRIIHKFENKKYYKNNLKRVAQLDINTEEVINIFNSITEALNFLNKPKSGNITLCCKGQRATAYGYKWKYIDN